MKFLKAYIFLSSILFSTFCKAQDDMPDTRRKTESFARFHYGNLRADLATFTLAGTSESVGALPLQKINYSTLGNDSITFDGDGIKAKVKIAPFDPAKHKLYYDDKYLIKIDRRPYYGDYGNVPKTYISEVSVIVNNNDTVFIPAIAYSDLYNLHFTYTGNGAERTTDAVYLSKDRNYIYLYLFCKNNSGSYEVTWIIQDGRYLRRVLDYGIM
ncbi:MAG TPA: hypothetical protein VFI29_16650 [Hanamia sp.]|nr:hypothetical protein [Hanamia sp.]